MRRSSYNRAIRTNRRDHHARNRVAVMRAAFLAVERLENRLLFSTYLGASASSQSTTPLGVNLGGESWYNTDALFYDAHKEMDGWRQENSPYSYLPSNELTATGYPLTNAYTETELNGYPTGTYTLQYSGGGSISASGIGTIVPNSTVTVNGVTTSQISVEPNQSDTRLLLYATVNPSNPISNMHLYLPGYNPSQPAPELNPAVAARLAPFGTLRVMDLLQTNNNTMSSWSSRTIPADFNYTTNQGVAYEDVIAIANQLHENLWWNIPVAADSDYMTKLAELFKYGSDGVNPYTGPAGSNTANPVPATGPLYPGLNPSLKLDIEFGNELWHDGTAAESYLINASYQNANLPGFNLPNGNPNANGVWVQTAEETVYELRQTYNAFSSVYGSGLSSQCQFVLAADTSTSDFTQTAFTYLNDMSSTWGAPSSWISALAVPTYVNIDSSVDVSGLTVDQIFANLNQQITGSFATTIQADVQFAQSQGLPLVSYEGGQALIPNNENAAVKNQAQIDPRMGQFYTALLNEWYSLGGSLILPFEFADANSTSGDWGLLQSANANGSPKWDAVIKRLVPLGDANLDGVVDWNDFVILRANYGLSGGVYWQQGDFNGDGAVNSADLTLLEQNIDLSNFTADQLSQYNAFLATAYAPLLLPENNIIGTQGSYGNDGDTSANAFDGDTSTFFDAPNASGNWVGLNLGSQYQVTEVRFAPRVSFEQRMIGGIFQASNDPNFVTGVVNLYTITSAPADGYQTVDVSAPGTYQYVRYLAPDGSYGNVSELQFYGEPPAPQGTPSITPTTTAQNTQSSSGLVITTTDPHTVGYQLTNITNGTLYLSDGVTALHNGSFVTLAQATAGLKFTPAANQFGSNFSFSAQATSTGDAGGLGGGIATASITVNLVLPAAAPSITPAITNEDTQSSSGLVITTTDANTVGYQITAITNGTLYLSDGVTPVTINSFITSAQATAGLRFTPASHQYGTNFSFSAQATSTGTVQGLGAAVVAASITVLEVAHSPSITGATTLENTPSTSGLVITPNTLDSSDAKLAYQITGITNGTLYLNDGVTPVTNGSFITAAEGAAGLQFAPTTGLSNPTSTFGFSVQASVDGTIAGLGGSVIPASVTVAALPSGTPTITPATTAEDTQSSSGLVITTTDPNTVGYQITAITNGTLYLNDGVTPVASGSFITTAQATAGLKFTPGSHLFGTNFSFSATATSTGTASGLGGSAATASITVNEAAHTPSITSTTTAQGVQSSSGLVITPNALDTTDTALAYQITGITGGTLYLSDGVTPVSNSAFITAAQGSAGLKFTPTSASAGFSIQASVDGAIAGLGGSVVPASITVNLPLPAGTPTITSATTAEDTQSTSGLVITATDPNTVGYQITGITNGTLYLSDGVTPVANNSFITTAQATAGLKFTPGSHLFGTNFSFSAQATNNGSTTGLGGGIATASITVNEVAHTPSITGASTTANTQTTSGLVITPNALDSSDPNLAYEITAIKNGTLYLSNGTTPVTSGSFITAAQGAAGLKFTPSTGLTSPSTTFCIKVRASVDGTTAGLGGSVVTAMITVNVATATVGEFGGVATANTTASYNSNGNNYANVFDGNVNTFFDAPNANGNWVQLDLGSAQTITAIAYAPRAGFESRMGGGIFEASNDPTFATGVATLYTVASMPSDGLTKQPVSPAQAYRYVRYVAPAGSYGNIAEMQVFGPGGTGSAITLGGAPSSGGGTTPTILTPTATSASTTLSYDGKSSDTYTAVFDGNTNSYFDSPSASGNWIQANLGAQDNITAIAYAPRPGFEYRMNGGIFEASNDPTFTTGVVTLFTITSTPSDGFNTQSVSANGYQYIRYVAPNNSYGNIAELQILGTSSSGTGGSTGGGSSGTTSPTQITPTATSASTTLSYDGLSSDTYTAVFDGNTNTYLDAPSASGVWVQANLGAPYNISSIAYAPRPGFEYRMNGGIFEASNDPTFTTGVVTLFTVSSTPSDGLNTQTVTANGYQYIRYLAPAGSYGNIAELQVFGTASSGSGNTGGSSGSGSTTPAQLTPAATSASNTGSYDGKSSDTYTAVFDGNTNTAWDSPNPSGNWVQVDLGTQRTITSISYAPRPGFEYRMIGGYFEASNDPTFSTGVTTLFTINSTPNDGLDAQTVTLSGTYRYIRYVAPANSYGNIAELQVFGY
jgi:hypothetical protein